MFLVYKCLRITIWCALPEENTSPAPSYSQRPVVLHVRLRPLASPCVVSHVGECQLVFRLHSVLLVEQALRPIRELLVTIKLYVPRLQP